MTQQLVVHSSWTESLQQEKNKSSKISVVKKLYILLFFHSIQNVPELGHTMNHNQKINSFAWMGLDLNFEIYQ